MVMTNVRSTYIFLFALVIVLFGSIVAGTVAVNEYYKLIGHELDCGRLTGTSFSVTHEKFKKKAGTRASCRGSNYRRII